MGVWGAGYMYYLIFCLHACLHCPFGVGYWYLVTCFLQGVSVKGSLGQWRSPPTRQIPTQIRTGEAETGSQFLFLCEFICKI